MTTFIVVRPLDLDRLVLAKGAHDATDGPPLDDCACLLEVAAYMAGEPWSDAPQCVCPALATFGRRLNDALPDGPRQLLAQYLVPMLGTAGDGLAGTRRYLATDWAVRVATPLWLDAAGQGAHAARLRALAAA